MDSPGAMYQVLSEANLALTSANNASARVRPMDATRFRNCCAVGSDDAPRAIDEARAPRVFRRAADPLAGLAPRFRAAERIA